MCEPTKPVAPVRKTRSPCAIAASYCRAAKGSSRAIRYYQRGVSIIREPALSDGYHPVPAGHLAAVQTFLEMRAKPSLRSSPSSAQWHLERLTTADLIRYRALFHRIGDEYLWTLRLLMADTELARYLSDSLVEVYVMGTSQGDEGILELDFREPGECEVGLFGVAAPLVGTGAGRWLMNRGIEIAWSHPIARFWLHTCSLDHPNALRFYLRSGFTPYARKVEVFPDPRALGLTRSDAAPHVPIL